MKIVRASLGLFHRVIPWLLLFVVACTAPTTSHPPTSNPASTPWLTSPPQPALTCTPLQSTQPLTANLSPGSIVNVTYPGYGWLFVVTIQLPASVQGVYNVGWEGEEFACTRTSRFLDQLDCNVPLFPTGKQAIFEVRSGKEAAIFRFTCRRLDPTGF